jgi:hypothetical protein
VGSYSYKGTPAPLKSSYLLTPSSLSPQPVARYFRVRGVSLAAFVFNVPEREARSWSSSVAAGCRWFSHCRENLDGGASPSFSTMGNPHYVGLCRCVHLSGDLDPRDGGLRGRRRGADYIFTSNAVPKSYSDCCSRRRSGHARSGCLVHRRPDFWKKTYHDLGHPPHLPSPGSRAKTFPRRSIHTEISPLRSRGPDCLRSDLTSN